MKITKLLGAAALVTLTTNSAFAQNLGVDASASADTGGDADAAGQADTEADQADTEAVSLDELPQEESTTAPLEESPATSTASDSSAAETTEEPVDDGVSDHQKVVNRFAVGYLGRQTLHYGVANTAVAAPIVGVRYWLNPMIGIDGGIGLNFLGGTAKTTDQPDVSAAGHSAVLFHIGVPLSLADKGHFSFQVVPEINLGFAGTGDQNPNDAIEQTSAGSFFNIGAKVGAELHFGFMGIPQLSLQGNIGVYLQTESVSDKTVANGIETKNSVSYTSFGSTLGPDPWDIFTSSVSALYYF